MATRTLSNSNTQLMNNELNHASRMPPKTGCDRDGGGGGVRKYRKQKNLLKNKNQANNSF